MPDSSPEMWIDTTDSKPRSLGRQVGLFELPRRRTRGLDGFAAGQGDGDRVRNVVLTFAVDFRADHHGHRDHGQPAVGSEGPDPVRGQRGGGVRDHGDLHDGGGSRFGDGCPGTRGLAEPDKALPQPRPAWRLAVWHEGPPAGW